MKKSVFGIARSDRHAEETIKKLHLAGFKSQYISALFRDPRNSTTENLSHLAKIGKGIGHEKESKASEGAATGAATGGIIGGTLGLIASSLAIPGLGILIAAGPIMTMLSGSAIGGGIGLFIGSLVGFGIPEYVAISYENHLKQGGILLSVHVESQEEMDMAMKVFENNGITDIASVSESSMET